MAHVRYPRAILRAVTAHAQAAFPGECRGVISGVRTRRGIDVVALHELGGRPAVEVSESRADREQSDSASSVEDRLVERLRQAGTPAICLYRSRITESGGEADDPAQVPVEGRAKGFPEMEHLIIDVSDGEARGARAFGWDGRSFVGRDVDLED